MARDGNNTSEFNCNVFCGQVIILFIQILFWLIFSANPDQDEEEEEEEELDEFGEPIKNKGSAHSGPWNKLEHGK